MSHNFVTVRSTASLLFFALFIFTANPTRAEEGVAVAVAAETNQAPEVKEEKKETSWTDYLKLKGDFRYRVEGIYQEDKDDRYRHRIRARAGVLANIHSDFSVLVQLGTGGSDDPVSNNQSLTDAFTSKPLWLDLAYFDWQPSFVKGLYLQGGKMKNPFVRVGKSELLFDPDLNPEGLALGYHGDFGIVEPFLHTSSYWVQERKADDDTWLFGVQGGLQLNLAGGGLYVLLGGGYFDYTNIKGKSVFWEMDDSYGNSATDVSGDPDNPELTYDNDYNVVEGFAEIGGKIINLPWAVFGDWALNTAADEENMGWLFGASVGKLKDPFSFKLRYVYRQVEKDTTVGLFSDSDFIGGGTDGKGHEINGAIQIVKGISFHATYFNNKIGMEDEKDYQRFQVDLKMKF